MAQGLMRAASLLLLTVGVCTAGEAARAQPLRDPTRPPQFSDVEPVSGATVQEGTRLQSVLLSSGRKLAVIDGQTVALGGRIADATVIDIAPGHVVLRRGGQTQTLKLHPAAEKRPSSSRDAP